MTGKLAFPKSRCSILSAVLIFLLASPVLLPAQTDNAPASTFIFPLFTASAAIDSGIAIFNPSTRPAVAALVLTDSNGQVAGSSTMTIAPLGQSAKTATQLFGPNPSGSVLRISSDTPGLVAYYQTFDSFLSFMDGADAPESASDLVFPVIPGPEEGFALVSFANANPRPTAVELKLWSFGGGLLGTATVQIPAQGSYASLVNDIFPPNTNFSGASHVTATSKPTNIFSQAQPVSATSLFLGFSSIPTSGGDVDLAALNALPLTRLSGIGVIPYFRIGRQNAATFALASIEPAAVDVTVTAVGNDGSILGTQRINLKPNGGIRVPLQNLIPSLGAGESEGWILIHASGRVGASVIYGRSDAPALTAVPMQLTPKFAMVFPQVVQNSSSFTEVTLANPAAVPSQVDISVVSADGVATAVNRITVPPGARVSQALDHWMPELQAQIGGYVFVQASEAIFALESIWNSEGATVTSFTPETTSVNFAPPRLKSFAVTGKVTLNGRPAPGFRIALSGPVDRLAISGNDGTYAFTQLPPGKYSISVDQYAFQFLPAQASFVISTASQRQDFQGFTTPDSIIVQPPLVPVASSDTTVTVFGRDFNQTSQVYAGLVRLATTWVDSTILNATIPEYLLAFPARLDITVITNDLGPNRKVSQPYALMVYQDRPTLTSVTIAGEIIEGSPGATATLIGTGFLAGARVKVNGVSADIQVTVVNDEQILAYIPSDYFQKGGIFPITVENPYPANVESNIQLLIVFYPVPAVQDITPRTIPARLEAGLGPVDIEVLGYGFRRGAVVLFNGQPVPTTYCEASAYCLAVHLYARVPADYFKSSGFAAIKVQNPTPSLAASEAAFLEIDGLQPRITSVLPGSATALELPFTFTMPVVVNGTNFGPQTLIRIYPASATEVPEFEKPKEVISSTQLYGSILVSNPESLGEWKVEVANPPPGGGISEVASFVIIPGLFVANPFLISMTPDTVVAGGNAISLTINGTNIHAGSQVYFNSTPLNAIVISDKQIRAEVPAQLLRVAGRVPIRVTNPDNGGSSNRLYLDIR